ncbi:MAG: GntR family transcriptional regulator [Timaviella obliquedivisa GSE-PSE-MK23-08B]|jgi:DNA-binding GntR family transcriptional regulator|nr:GntR family transcriptional regulator [Timaviella obliquedivisa GSE-PSE-MK23-08B]
MSLSFSHSSRDRPNSLLKVNLFMPAAPSPTPSNKPTEDVIYTELYNSILERRLPPKTKLGESLLAEYYGVSRTIIRQVLQRLAHDRLVKLEPNRGAFVSSLSLEESKQLYEAWRLTEAAIVREVTQTITRKQIAALKKLVAEERQACEAQDIPRLTLLSAHFHIQLADLCRNRFLGKFLRELVPQASLAFFYEVRSMPICTKDEHSEILECIASGNEEAAVAAAMRHLDGIEKALNSRASLKKPTSLTDLLNTRIPSSS